MTIQSVLLPVFVLVALTFALLVWTGRSRLVAVRRGEVKVGEIVLGQQAWPEGPTKVGNNFHNQFQLPVLFYVAVIIAIITQKADLIFVVLEWLFVAARLVHTYVHTGSNHLPSRFNVFLAGFLVLAAMWLMLAVRILAGI